MRVELFQPDSETEPRHWVRHDQAFAMMLGLAQLSGAQSVPRWKTSPTRQATWRCVIGMRESGLDS
jgi:hypothetical protein